MQQYKKKIGVQEKEMIEDGIKEKYNWPEQDTVTWVIHGWRNSPDYKV